MICQNPHLQVPHETDFIVPMAFILDRVQNEKTGKRLIADMICSTAAYEPSLGRFLDRPEVCEIVESSQYSLFGLLDGIYAAVAKKAGAIVAGDKSPNDLGFVGILKKTGLFESNIKIIHIVRDVRDVILSLKKTGWAPADVEHYFPGIWANSNLNLRRFASQGRTPYLLVRYEDLVLDPLVELQKICTFLDVDFNQSMCDYEELGKELSHLPHHQNLGKEMLQDRRFAWKQEVGTTLFSACRENAGSVLQEFGYEY